MSKGMIVSHYYNKLWILTTARACSYLLPLIFFLLITSCGSDRKTFLLEGTFKGFNQGELYIFGMNGNHRMDTISVVKGRIHYEITLEDTVTLSLVFPNFSELPIFAEPRAEVEIEADASHLKETRISGTETNEEMTEFRLQTGSMTPSEATKAAETFIKEHPASPVALYLLHKYFTQIPSPDYKKCIELIGELQKAQPEEPSLKGLTEKMKGLGNLKDGAKIPNFTATDINGKTVKSSDLDATVNIIFTWAKWNYESVSMQRQLTYFLDRYKDNLKIVGICVDVDKRGCRKTAEKDSVKWSTICDGKMWESPVLKQLGLSYVPDNIMTDSKGKIIAHTLPIKELQDKARTLLDPKKTSTE
jgi:peroxiredoxin